MQIIRKRLSALESSGEGVDKVCLIKWGTQPPSWPLKVTGGVCVKVAIQNSLPQASTIIIS